MIELKIGRTLIKKMAWLLNLEALLVATNNDLLYIVDRNTNDGSSSSSSRGWHAGNGWTVIEVEYSSKCKSINVNKPSK